MENEIDEDSEIKELQAYFEDDDDSEPFETPDPRKQELKQLISQIDGVINCLLRLSVAISNPAPHDRIKSRASEQIGFYEPWDIEHVRAKFPVVDHRISERLGKTLTQRRRYLKYREDQHRRLKQGLEGDRDGASDRAATNPVSLPQKLKDSSDINQNLNHDSKLVRDDPTSYAASKDRQDERRVPPIPKEYAKGPFLCPFCFAFISVGSREAWE